MAEKIQKLVDFDSYGSTAYEINKNPKSPKLSLGF